jgi:transposase-like protein
MDTVTEFTEVKGACKYQRRTRDEKRQIVEETLSSGRSVAEIARSHEVNANQVFDWRKQYLEGRLGADTRECALLPPDGRANSPTCGHLKIPPPRDTRSMMLARTPELRQ